MIQGYRDIYLNDVMENFGIMFFLCGYFHINKDRFFNILLTSGIAEEIERGNPKYLTGMCGFELMEEAIGTTGQDFEVDFPQNLSGCENIDYWSGWILAYYQWKSARSFHEIQQYLSFHDLDYLYQTGHEEHEDTVFAIIDELIKDRKTETNLRQLRTCIGLTQEELAREADVNVRSIRAYEQKTKDINKASAEILFNLSRAIGCRMEDLLEF